MKKVLFFLSGLFCAYSLAAQCVTYEHGTRAFYATNEAGDSLITLTLHISAGGAVTVSRSVTPFMGTPSGDVFHLMAVDGEFSISSAPGDPLSVELVSATAAYQYYLLDFNTPDPVIAQLSGNGDKVEIACTCKRGGGSCSVSYQSDGRNNLCATCVAEAECRKCKMTTTKVGSGGRATGSAILVRATGLTVVP